MRIALIVCIDGGASRLQVREKIDPDVNDEQSSGRCESHVTFHLNGSGQWMEVSESYAARGCH